MCISLQSNPRVVAAIRGLRDELVAEVSTRHGEDFGLSDTSLCSSTKGSIGSPSNTVVHEVESCKEKPTEKLINGIID